MTVAETYLSKWPAKSDTRRTMRGAIRQIARVLGEKGDALAYPFEDLRYEVVRGIPAALRDAGLSVRSVNKALTALRGLLETAWSTDAMPDEAYRRIGRVRNLRGKSLPAGRALDGDDVAVLSRGLSAVSPRDAAMIVVLYACGLRRVEASKLRREDYDPRDGRLRARGKGDKERAVPVAEAWRVPLEAHWRTLRSRSPMFPSLKGGQALKRAGVTYVVENFCRKAGGKRFTPHDLRRTFATAILEGGGDLLVTKRLMGHESLDTTSIYDRRGEAAEREAVEVLKRPGTESQDKKEE